MSFVLLFHSASKKITVVNSRKDVIISLLH